jgi:hypothetical protein
MRTALALLLVSLPAAASPRYYLVMRGVEGSADVPHEVVKKLLAEEVAKHDEFVTEKAGDPTDPKALADKLAGQKLKGYYVTVKVLEAGRKVTEPANGRRGQLQRNIKLSVVGATIPDQQVSFGGVGESAAATEVGKNVDPKEEAALLSDAVKDAVQQAVSQALGKLTEAGKPAKAPAKKKAKK